MTTILRGTPDQYVEIAGLANHYRREGPSLVPVDADGYSVTVPEGETIASVAAAAALAGTPIRGGAAEYAPLDDRPGLWARFVLASAALDPDVYVIVTRPGQSIAALFAEAAAEEEAPPPPARRRVAKSTIIARLTDAELDAALAAMTTRQQERWRAPDQPAIYADDPEAVALLTAIGADADVILAP